MLKKLFIFSLFIFTKMAYALPKQSIICPSEIKVTQNLTASVKDWRVFNSSANHYLSQIEIYAGNPEDQACLKPDSQTNEKAIWHFVPNSHPYIMCRYQSTSIQLTQPLPSSIKQCTVWFQKYAKNTDGGGIPEKVICQ